MPIRHRPSRRRQRRRSGKILVLFAIALPLLLTLVAYVVGLTYIQLTRMKLQAVVDTTVAAAADRYSLSRDIDSAKDVAIDVAKNNEIQGEPLVLGADAIEFGRYEQDNEQWVFYEGRRNPNAIRLTANVTVDRSLGPATLLKFLDRNVTVDVTRTSIATEIDRDIALTADRSFWTAFGDDEVAPTEWIDFGPELEPIPVEWLETVPLNAPEGWTWCLPVPALSKWLQMIVATEAFLGELALTGSDEQVALVTFASDGTIDEPLSFNYPGVVETMRRLANSFCGGPANVEAGIDAGVQSLTDQSTARPFAEKVLILLVGSPKSEGDPIDAANNALAAGVVVHAVSYGANTDTELMERVAAAGGGKHWHARNVVELTLTLKQIANSPRVIVVHPGS